MKKGLLILLALTVALSIKVDATTWYVRSSGGSNDSLGTSFAKAFAKTQVAWDSCQAGDSIVLCGGPFTLTASDTLDMNNGAHASALVTTPIRVLGANASGTVYEFNNDSTVQITTASTLATGLLHILITADYFRFRNIEWNGGGVGKAEYCIQTPAADGSDGHVFTKCHFKKADNSGLFIRIGGSQTWEFFNCEIDSNGLSGTGSGIAPTTAGRGNYNLYDCYIHDNDDNGVTWGGNINTNKITNCIFSDNGIDGINLGATTYLAYITNCVFFSNGGDGIDVAQNPTKFVLYNCIFRSNGGYGINTNTSDIDCMTFVNYNCANGNGTNPIDINGNVLPGIGNVTGDPLFTSETDGAEDFTLQAASPCKNVGCQNVAF
jgi:hypothetical protein